jgi:hypothetical protein
MTAPPGQALAEDHALTFGYDGAMSPCPWTAAMGCAGSADGPRVVGRSRSANASGTPVVYVSEASSDPVEIGILRLTAT